IAENFVEAVSVDDVCEAFRALATEFGDYRGGTAFGDWTLRPEDARTFEERGLQAYNVLRSRTGKDRSDPAMMLEVYDWVRDRDDIGVVILGSGDSDFKELIRRGKQRGKELIVFAIAATISGELPKMTGPFPLQSRMRLTPKSRAGPLPGFPLSEDLRRFQAFVLRLDSVERKLPYVVYSYLRDTLLSPAWGAGNTELDRAMFLSDAEEKGIMEFDTVDNPKVPGKKTTIVRLNRDNEIVKELLPDTGKGAS
ncbi:MAG: NYN domain-containing protein, partial [Dehalococcoidia bacterium]